MSLVLLIVWVVVMGILILAFSHTPVSPVILAALASLTTLLGGYLWLTVRDELLPSQSRINGGRCIYCAAPINEIGDAYAWCENNCWNPLIPIEEMEGKLPYTYVPE